MTNPLFERLEDMGAEVEDALERLMGDEKLYLSYLRQLPENQNITALRAAVDAGDCETAAKEAHALKGVALNLGLLPLADACMDMLLDFRAGDNEKALSQMAEVENTFRIWASAVKE